MKIFMTYKGIVCIFILSVLFGWAVLPVAQTFAANLSAFTSISHGGLEIHQGDIVMRDSLDQVNNYWHFAFTWPHQVPNMGSYFAIARGTFGNIEGGVVQPEVNYSYNNQNWNVGDNIIGKQFGVLPLGNLNTTSHVYTAIVAEVTAGSPAEIAEWFASGGISGVEPTNYSFLTFEYKAESNPVRLDTLVSVWHGNKVIFPGDTVSREDFTVFPINSDMWEWEFSWTNEVQNMAALFVVFRGTFGNLENGEPAQGENYGYNLQAFASGKNLIGKHIDLPPLTNATPHIYTTAIMERDPKYLDFSVEEQIKWFASGGTEGIPPRKYAFLTFELKATTVDCCSSVAFIPGVTASRLYVDEVFENQLWEPNINADVEKLALDVNGNSINDIYTKEVIDEINFLPIGQENIYKTFLQKLEELKDEEIISDWEALPYDWRFNVEDIASGDIKLKNEVYRMTEKIADLAASSATDKVTIIAHSNGGLVAKMLINELEGQGKSDLVDKLILVAVPQIGTPEAIGRLLHGDGMKKGAGLIINEATAREVMENMPSAYNLLPSPAYFDNMISPIITFSSTTALTESFRDFYGGTIDSFSEFRQFLLGQEGREKPAATETNVPAIANAGLYTEALATAAKLDSWELPTNSGIEVYQIIGWGLDTPYGIWYSEKMEESCPSGGRCVYGPVLTYEVSPVVEGDGTVVYRSADFVEGVKSFYVDLSEINGPILGKNYEHEDILEADSVKDLISKIVSGDTFIELPVYVSTIKPEPSSDEKRLRLKGKSPIQIGVTDSKGRFTGVVKNVDETFVVEQIPNSYYWQYGGIKYVGLPMEDDYTIEIEGTDFGTFTFEITEVTEDGSSEKTLVFADIPVTPDTKAQMTLQDVDNRNSLAIDMDGDGRTDVKLDAEEGTVDPLGYIDLMLASTKSMEISRIEKRQLTTMLTVLKMKIKTAQEIRRHQSKLGHWSWRFPKKGEYLDLSREINEIIKRVERDLRFRKINAEQAEVLIKQLEVLKGLIEG